MSWLTPRLRHEFRRKHVLRYGVDFGEPRGYFGRVVEQRWAARSRVPNASHIALGVQFVFASPNTAEVSAPIKNQCTIFSSPKFACWVINFSTLCLENCDLPLAIQPMDLGSRCAPESVDLRIVPRN